MLAVGPDLYISQGDEGKVPNRALRCAGGHTSATSTLPLGGSVQDQKQPVAGSTLAPVGSRMTAADPPNPASPFSHRRVVNLRVRSRLDHGQRLDGVVGIRLWAKHCVPEPGDAYGKGRSGRLHPYLQEGAPGECGEGGRAATGSWAAAVSHDTGEPLSIVGKTRKRSRNLSGITQSIEGRSRIMSTRLSYMTTGRIETAASRLRSSWASTRCSLSVSPTGGPGFAQDLRGRDG